MADAASHSPAPRRRRSLPVRIVRWLGIAIGGFLVFSVVEVVALKYINPIGTPLMVIRRAEALFAGDSAGIEYTWRPLEQISPNLLRAVIAAEDGRFFSHNGFDWTAIDRAMKHNKRSKRQRGASTISMQCARNVFLWQGRNWIRKGLEAWYTVLIEFLWGKRRILEVYLNVVEWGSGVYGAEAGALHAFRVNASAISLDQASAMAAVLPNPRRWSPDEPTGYIRFRASYIAHRARGVALPKSALRDE
jgi:monofunctional biosynthetic peptidoglycan transglycosylase